MRKEKLTRVWLVWFAPDDCPEVWGVHYIGTSLGAARGARIQLNRQNGWPILDMPIRQYKVGELL